MSSFMSALGSLLFLLILSTTITCVTSRITIVEKPLDAIIPYPQPAQPPSLVYFVETSGMQPDQHITLLTLKGLLSQQFLRTNNASIPLIFTSDTPARPAEPVYWSAYTESYKSTTFDKSTFQGASASDVITALASHIRGYFLVNVGEENVNVGISLASITHRTVVATSKLAPLLNSLGVPLVRDVRNVTEKEFIGEYNSKSFPFNRRFVSVQQPVTAAISLTDWSICVGAVQVAAEDSYQTVLDWMAPSGPMNAVFGWVPPAQPDEHGYVQQASTANGMVLASDWMYNLATHVLLHPTTPLVNPTKGSLSPLPDNRGKHTVTLFFSDGDNICANMNNLLDSGAYGSSDRGSVPVGWGLNPTLSALAPVGLQTYYRMANATTDSFIAFSAGYAYGNDMTNKTLNAWAEETSNVMKTADMSVMNYIADTFDVRTVQALHAQPYIDGTYFMPYTDYVPDYPNNGTVEWSHGKPSVSMRECLRQGHSTPQSIAQLVNALSTNHTSVDAYSAIVIHIWSMTMTDVKNCINMMDTSRVIAVKPDQFIQLMKNNVQPS